MNKYLDEMTIKDAFMFAAIMSYKEIAREVFEVILNKKIKDVKLVTEKTLQFHPEYKGVRLDVLIDEEGENRHYDIEMQLEKKFTTS